MTLTQLELKIGDFQGPFDLLLHLIKQMKVEINDIPMTEITQQYMAYLAQMQSLELDIVGDYLVMAATLLEIKSRLLLPIEPESELIAVDETGDPRRALVQQLLLYQQFQDVASLLEEKQMARARLFAKPTDDLSEYQNFIPLNPGEISLSDLVAQMQVAMQKLYQNQPEQREIYHDPQTVEQKMSTIMLRLDQLPTDQYLAFESLLNVYERQEIITTFMALLELVKKQALVLYQSQALGPIEVKKV